MNRLDPLEIPDLLANLVERSIAVCDSTTGRYHLSESMRVYASDQLADQQSAMQHAHFEYFLSKAEYMLEHSEVGEDAKAIALFLPEVDNFRHAYEWAIVNDSERCLRFMRCLGPSWFRMSRNETEPLVVRALAAAPENADNDHIAIRMQLARAKLRQHSFDEARSLLDAAVRQSNEIDVEPTLHVHLTTTVGVLEFFAGNNDLARERTLEALHLAKKYHLPSQEASAISNLGEICRQAGDFLAAKQYYEEGLRLSSDDQLSNTLTLFNLGCTALELNEVADAEDCFRRALAFYGAVMGIDSAGGPIGGLGYICVLRKSYREAGLLMGFPEARRNSNKSRMDPMDEQIFERYRKLGSELGGKEFEQAFRDGAHLTVEQLISLVDNAFSDKKDGDR